MGLGVPRDNPHEGCSPWDFALVTPGSARISICYFIFLTCESQENILGYLGTDMT